MEVLQVECIIHHLFHIGLQDIFLSYLEFKTEYDATKQQDHIDALAQSRYFVFEDYLRVLTLPRYQYLLHDVYLAHPGLVGCSQCVAMIVAMESAQNSKAFLLKEFLKGICI